MNDTIIQTKKSRRQKFAIFDFDWTLVKPLEGRKFPKDATDWQYIRPSVVPVVRKYAKDYQIVIVTDQSKLWKVDQIKAVIADLDIDVTVIIGVKETSQKPSTDLFLSTFPKFDHTKAFYVGDAAGRKGDWSDKDKVFADRLEVKFYTPEELFPLETVTIPSSVKPVQHKEVIIMVGYPASGKTTIAKTIFEPVSYYRVDGDSLKTAKAMIKDAEKHVGAQSILFDSTAGTKDKRAQFIGFAQKHNLPVRVLWVQTSIEQSIENNKQRGSTVPLIAFYMYRKNFEPPTEDEGFTLTKI